MQDNTTTLAQLKKITENFTSARDWHSYHSLKNISEAICVESSELLEIFLWTRNNEEIDLKLKDQKTEIKYEVADVFFALLNFANRANIDLAAAFEEKLKILSEKYPTQELIKK